jgi:hypothetical protein
MYNLLNIQDLCAFAQSIFNCVSYEYHSKQRLYLQTTFNYFSFETEMCACFEVGNEFKCNPEDDASTSVVGFWSLIFGPISQESWFDSWQRWKLFFIFNPPSPALELIRLHVH